jgi:hypothetical protein
MLTVVAPAATTARQTCTKKSGSVREPSSGRKLDVLHKRFGAFDPFHRQPENFVPRLVQLEFAMNFRRGQKNVDAPAFAGRFDGFAGGVDVARHAAGQAADDRAFDLAGDGADGGEIAVADDGKAGLDDIDAQAGQLAGDLELFAQVHGSAGALLAVAQGRVEYNDAIVFHNVVL